MTTETTPVAMDITRSTNPVRYVWVEVYEIELDEETQTSRSISTRCWPDVSTLREKVEAAKGDPLNQSLTSHLMRRDEWERRNRG